MRPSGVFREIFIRVMAACGQIFQIETMIIARFVLIEDRLVYFHMHIWDAMLLAEVFHWNYC